MRHNYVHCSLDRRDLFLREREREKTGFLYKIDLQTHSQKKKKRKNKTVYKSREMILKKVYADPTNK